ncbi:MAG: ATP-grasp domain-containing protein [Gammaproteobacteria bacterium]|nr:ATP-grasp domain-containing protein [Gammaproteobacteria bacterium]
MPNTIKKRLLLISHHNSYRIAPYINAAIHLNLEVSIASEGKHSLVTEVANGIHIDFNNIQATLATIHIEHRKRPFSGILGSDDQTVEFAAHIAHELQLPHNPPRAAQYSYRKDLARKKLALACCPVPTHHLLDVNLPLTKQMTGLHFPCVLKPLNMSASRGVIRVNDSDEFVIAWQRLKSIVATALGKFEQSHILVENYIDGIEIAYEGFLHDGKLNSITIFDKPDPLEGPYFEETIYVMPSSLNTILQQKVKSVIQKACGVYGLTTGAIHAECRIDKDEKIWILEIASRTIGGDCARILDNENFSIEELAISLAINQPIDVCTAQQARGVMMLPVTTKGLLKRVEGLLEANRIKYIDKIDIIINEGHELVPLPEGNQYLGYIFASADTPEQVICAIREAYAKLTFITAPIFTIR